MKDFDIDKFIHIASIICGIFAVLCTVLYGYMIVIGEFHRACEIGLAALVNGITYENE